MQSLIDSVKYNWGIGSEERKHEILFSPGLNVVAGEPASGKTIIFEAINNEVKERGVSVIKEKNIVPIKDYKEIMFFDEGVWVFYRKKRIEKVFSNLNIREEDMPFLLERLNIYVNRMLKIKTLSPSKFLGINDDCEEGVFDCAIEHSFHWCIKHKLTGENLSTLFYAKGEQVIMDFSLNFAIRDLIKHKPPFVIDSCLCWLDEHLIEGLWSEVVRRTEQVIVFESPRVWEKLEVTPTHVLLNGKAYYER